MLLFPRKRASIRVNGSVKLVIHGNCIPMHSVGGGDRRWVSQNTDEV